MKNPIFDQIFSHRSVRSFDTSFSIPRDEIELIVRAGQQASTSCSGQMYTIIEIPKEDRQTVLLLCGNQTFVQEASYFCIICVDLYRLHQIVKQSKGKNQDWPIAGMMIGIFDAGLMAQNMVLAAESLGYDICFCGSCGDKPVEMIEELNLPELVMPLTGLAIGKGTENPPSRPRLHTSTIHHKKVYHSYSKQELEENIEHMSNKLNQEGYYSKYTGRENFTWRDHMKNKFGGKWLNIIEKNRINAMEKQGFFQDKED